MNLVAVLLAPFALLLPAAGGVEARDEAVETGRADWPFDPAGAPAPMAYPDEPVAGDAPHWPTILSGTGFEPDPAWQIRIERRMTIRITPLAPQPRRTDMLFGVPNREIGPHFVERKMGKCLTVSGISGVQPNGGNRLLLFMRDQRIVSAELERSCTSRDFYSGFYLSKSNDGKLCVDRDTLLSRSGVNCKLSSIRQLVEVSD
ncbi:hypothetical protein B2G71_06835 [Novosphingobium sp. PC22D]|uniref:hypothetical protein n=1 Tax=Novosphingobium sp. PC22D TaxID=1962403 RepID=UPI000BEF4A01|nr:hypothetical protein [Novosphingobium sp. PC22D]PEQ13162.1 hypothetical protein B2G71_06835 [Novosphingobium sp. PC22D]